MSKWRKMSEYHPDTDDAMMCPECGAFVEDGPDCVEGTYFDCSYGSRTYADLCCSECGCRFTARYAPIMGGIETDAESAEVEE